MIDLSVLIPARNERFLRETVADVLAHAKANTEVIVVLDGAWPDPAIPDHPRLRMVYLGASIGQRAATNYAARLSEARYVMKLDAHCSVDDGFDVKLIAAAEELGPDVTQIPAQRNLHVFDYVCRACGWRQDHGVAPAACGDCQTPGPELELVWQPRPGSTKTDWTFTAEPKFQYGGAGVAQPAGEICDVMSSLGACFFMRRDRFWEIGGLDEAHGSWGNFGVEIACKSWLSGGRHVVNKRTWFAHFFRVGGIGFPYPVSGSDHEAARAYSRRLWFSNAWAGQVRPLSWLVDKFWPIRGWTDQDRAAVIEAGLLRLPASLPTGVSGPRHGAPAVTPSGDGAHASLVVDLLRDLGDTRRPVVAPVPGTETGAADSRPVFIGRRGEGVAFGASRLPSVDRGDGSASEKVAARQTEVGMRRIAATGILADDVVQVGNQPTDALRNGSDQPREHHTMRQVPEPKGAGLAVSLLQSSASPDPATGRAVDRDLGEQSSQLRTVDMGDREKLGGSHASASSADVRSGASSRSRRDDAPVILPNTRTKAIVYYSDCVPDPKVLETCRRTIEHSGLPVVAVTLKPIDWPAATNIVLPLPRGYLTLFRQILVGLIAAQSDVVFLAEHDVLYHPSHWAFAPPLPSAYYYQMDCWKVDAATGRAVTYETKQTSQLCADRALLIQHYQTRVARVERDGFTRRMGFEPGSHRRPERVDDVPSDTWRASAPNVDIRHGKNLTSSRWRREEFRDQRSCRGWTEGDGVPGWGRTLGRFDAFLADVQKGQAHGD